MSDAISAPIVRLASDFSTTDRPTADAANCAQSVSRSAKAESTLTNATESNQETIRFTRNIYPTIRSAQTTTRIRALAAMNVANCRVPNMAEWDANHLAIIPHNSTERKEGVQGFPKNAL